MSTTDHEVTLPVERPPELPPFGAHSRRRIALLASLALLALVAAGLVATRDGDGDGNGVEPAASTATTEEVTTSSAAPTTTAPTTTEPSTTVLPPSVDTTSAVFPSNRASGFGDPVDAARHFAIDFVGFVDPVVGGFQQGDTQSGEVEVRPDADGPITTVMVRRLGGSWWVLGAATANIDLRKPEALATIASPVRLEGVSTAFEANVSVEIRQDGARDPIGEGYVMGGSMGELGPFAGSISFARPSSSHGAVVLYTASMENGNMWEASVVRIRFS